MACVRRKEFKNSDGKVTGYESVDSMIKRFKTKVNREGIISEYRSRTEYKAPSLKRRLKSAAARTRRIKEARKFG